MADGWNVTSQRQTEELTPDGRFVHVVEIHFQLSDTGETGMVTIPIAAHDDPDYVAQIIQRRVDAIRAVRDL